MLIYFTLSSLGVGEAVVAPRHRRCMPCIRFVTSPNHNRRNLTFQALIISVVVLAFPPKLLCQKPLWTIQMGATADICATLLSCFPTLAQSLVRKVANFGQHELSDNLRASARNVWLTCMCPKFCNANT